MRTQWVQWLQSTRGWNANVLSLLIWAVIFALVQAWGQEARSDWSDGLGLAGLGLAALGTWFWHREVPLGWVHECGVFLRRWRIRLLRARPRLGIDFRHDPPIRGAIPVGYWIGPAFALALAGSAWAAGRYWPQGIRAALVPDFYLLYLLGIGTLWAFAFWLSALAIVFVFAQVHAWFELRRRLSDGRRGGLEFHLHAFLILDLFLCMGFASTGLGMGVLIAAGTMCLFLWSLPRPEPEILLWRTRKGEQRSLRVQTRTLLVGAWPVVGCAAVVSLLRGNWFGEAALTGMPVSALLAKICAWSCAAGASLLAVRQVVRFIRDCLGHPAYRHRPVVHVSGLLTDPEKRQTQRALRRQGLRVRFGGQARAHEVAVRVQNGGMILEEASQQAFGAPTEVFDPSLFGNQPDALPGF